MTSTPHFGGSSMLRTIPHLFVTVLLVGGGSRQQCEEANGDDHAAHFRNCAQACHDCQRECDICAAYCGKMVAEGKREHFNTLQTCQDCATHCGASAAITARMGSLSDLICKACAQACARCATACEAFPDDAHL